MSRQGLDALRERVISDPDLARRLRAIESERFANELVLIAVEYGCDVAESDVDDAVAQSRRAWSLRWIR